MSSTAGQSTGCDRIESRPPPVPLPPRAARLRRFLLLLLAAALVLGGGWLLRAHAPSGQFFYPRCHFHAATGLHCPGCGSTRALHHLLHGDVAAALRSNALLILGLPVLGVWGARAIWRTGRARAGGGFSGRWAWAALAVLMIFFVVRNLPGAPQRLLNPPPSKTQLP